MGDSQYFENSKKYRQILSKLQKSYGKTTASAICSSANEEYQKLLKSHPDLSKLERKHTDDSIFPRIAMYKAMQTQINKQDAIKIIENGVWAAASEAGEFFRKFTRLKFMRSIFLLIFRFGTKNMFGNSAGFHVTFYPAEKGDLKFDITQCPYCIYCKKYGCEDLIHTFCKSDEYCYGNLHGIEFKRLQTLGEGGTCCDFHLYRTDKVRD